MEEMQPATKEQAGAPPEPGAEPPPRSFWGRPAVIIIGTILLALLLFVSLEHLVASFTHESTDDAFLDTHIVSVAPRIAGQVQKVAVKDNQFVNPGDLVVEIDPRDLALLLEQKHSAVDSARANVQLLAATLKLFQSQIEAAQATAKQTSAEMASSEAANVKAQADIQRAEELMRNKTISQAEYDAARAAAAGAKADLEAAREKAASDASKVAQAEAQLGAGRKAYERGEAQTRQAELEAKTAELNLSYARIFAPAGGRVTRKSVEPGDYVQAGQRLLAVVSTQLWVTANFKETQLRKIRSGQRARIEIDSVEHRALSGHVDSIQAGSGARFSLLPPENAVGNFVKVVQRVPVKIVFDEPLPNGHVLGPGMSVVPSVRVRGFEMSEPLQIVASVLLALLLGGLWWLLAHRRTRGRPAGNHG